MMLDTIPIRASFIATSLFPIFSTLVPISAIELIKKLIHKRATLPSKAMFCVAPHSGDSTRSVDADPTSEIDAQAPKAPSLIFRTHFELTTGAYLADQFGLFGDYDNCVAIKGLPIASADGDFSNGFVIASSKSSFRPRTAHHPRYEPLRTHVRNVHVYDVDSFSVGAMARTLVYLALRDLAHQSIFILKLAVGAGKKNTSRE